MAREKQNTKRKGSNKEEEEEEAITTKASSSTVGNGVEKEEPPNKKAKVGRPKRGKASSSGVVAADDAAPPPPPPPPPPAPAQDADAAVAATKPKKKAVASKPKKKAAASKPKKEVVPKPKKETEYFEEKRNMEDLWKAAFPVGTEWDQLDSVYQYNWDFSNLENAFEEGGKLYGEKVYLFGCTEPQLVGLKGEVGKVVCIPVVVAVVSPFPPSDKIGINSVQREAEEIIPMKEMKMDWVPYIPLEYRDNLVDRLKSQIFILSCTQRRTCLRQMKIERMKKFEYCLPYFYQPMKEDEFEQSTVVDIMFPVEPPEPPVICDFDWDMDDLEEFVGEKVEDESITEDQRDAFKEFIKEKVREAKKANREAREARKKNVEEMSAETKDALNKMRFYKFYPVESPDTPDVSKVKSPFINRYYGKAHEVL